MYIAVFANIRLHHYKLQYDPLPSALEPSGVLTTHNILLCCVRGLYSRDCRNDIMWILNRLAHDAYHYFIAWRPAVVALLINTKIKNCLLSIFNKFLFATYALLYSSSHIIIMLSYTHVLPLPPHPTGTPKTHRCSDLYSYLPCCPPLYNVIYGNV